MNNDNTLESSSAINTHILKKFKIVFLGDQGVGKTSIIKRFIFDNFDENNSATIGVDLISKNITVDNKTVRLNLWDTAGQERFRCLIPGYIRDSNVAIAVYDITRKDTFNSLQGWINDVKSQREDDVLLAIAGCKSDLDAKREVSTEEAKKFADEHKALFSEVSAKTGSNISNMFQQVVNQLLGGLGASQIQIPVTTEGRGGPEPKFHLDPHVTASQTAGNANEAETGGSTIAKEKKQGGGCCA
jgi:Ras-related protein Rab-6A